MTSTNWSWLLAIVGTLASIAGVVFSWLAWVQATKAKEAAREAADSVRTRNLSHDFSRWAVNARDLLQAVRELRFESAQRAATDLFGVLAHNKGWQAGLKHETNLAEVERVVRILALVNTYTADNVVFESKQRTLAKQCQAIYGKLNELAGNLDAEVENL
ncbi:MAG: hypothetical protein WBE72_04230 [Terracidiphilus sp.]